ncbi:MAG: hypothetical protein COB49_04320 [Alphaproteobacteria bacterium]|nr:MAG: hypothetical protein COB49_04320 [Alphaproteobacteria bacterium]
MCKITFKTVGKLYNFYTGEIIVFQNKLIKQQLILLAYNMHGIVGKLSSTSSHLTWVQDFL